MIKALFHNLFFEPLYNALILIINVLPWTDLGIAVVVLTIIVKLILFPLSKKAVHTQIKMKELQKPLEEIKEKYKNDRAAQGQATLELYREHKLNPFSSILLIFIQLPVVLALFFVFSKVDFHMVDLNLLYSFVDPVDNISVNFLGIANLTEKSWILALLAGITQHFQARYSFPKQEEKKTEGKRTFQEDMVRGMGIQIKYVLPVVIVFVAYNFVSVVALYWVISNLFAIGQEVYIRNKIRKPAEVEAKQRDQLTS